MKATVIDRRFSFAEERKKEAKPIHGSAPCFHPVNLSAVQDGVEVLLRIRDGLEVIGVHKSFDDRL